MSHMRCSLNWLPSPHVFNAQPITYGLLHASGSTVAYLDLVVLQDDGNFTLTARMLEHLIELCLVLINIKICRSVPIDRPGLVGIGSTCFAVYNNFVFHRQSPFM